MKPLFELQSLACARGSATTANALSDVNLRMMPGEFVAICGLNGAGKSTLLEIMSGLLDCFAGSCCFEGRPVSDWQPRELARRVSFLPQNTDATPRFTGAEVVHMGRYPHGRGWAESSEDHDICVEAMRLADCEELASRFVTELSGGERQRVLFAAALAQKPAALILDEPGAFVDLPHQIRMFRTLRELCSSENVLCVAATHDLNLAAAFCSRIVLLDRGRVAADAPPDEVLAGQDFRRIFGENVRVERSASGALRVHYEI